MWTEVGEEVDGGSVDGFLDALAIWINKPHVVNRRLCGSCTVYENTLRTHLSPEDCLVTLRENGQGFSSVDAIETTLSSCLLPNNEDIEKRDIEITVRDLHPKLLEKFCTQREVVLIDRERAVAVFIPLLLVAKDGQTSNCHQPAYRIIYNNKRISIAVSNSCEPSEAAASLVDYSGDSQHTATKEMPGKSESQEHLNKTDSANLQSGAGCREDWLRDHLLRKVGQWSFHDDLNTGVTSLRLVPLDRYNLRYNEMKNKYGPHLVKNWPESTDPQKFVYEDISIAAYLLTMWEVERAELGLTELQSFVDLGCGNGLLVHLLAEEGHPGKGIDLRKRNIWDGFYGPKTCLEEFTLTPSDKNLFEGYDWLIGNHSDELTPWIPVMAARSSYNCRYFVLPCCSHDFDSRYREKAHGKSQYRCYLDFVQIVGETCGFTVQEDTLRIPSTKRVCFIGKSRTYPTHEEASVDAVRTDFIACRCSNQAAQTSEECGDESWATNFKARSSVEKPRNCISLDKELQQRVVCKVFEAVLKADSESTVLTEDGRSWHTGGSIPLADVVPLFDSDVMKELKNECGGLQTLLRNHYHVFRVQAGCVHIRDMGSEDEVHWIRKKKLKGNKSEKDMRKTRLCYLHQNHPDGCPKVAEQCRFAHGEDELKVIPRTDGIK